MGQGIRVNCFECHETRSIYDSYMLNGVSGRHVYPWYEPTDGKSRAKFAQVKEHDAQNDWIERRLDSCRGWFTVNLPVQKLADGKEQ